MRAIVGFLAALLLTQPCLSAPLPHGGGSFTAAPIDQFLATKSVGQLTWIDATSGNTYQNVRTAMTKANFNGAVNDPFTTDAAVQPGVDIGNSMGQAFAFGGPVVSSNAKQVCGYGGGHAAANRNDVNCFDVTAAVTSMNASSTPGSWRNVMKASALQLATDTNCPPSGSLCPPSPSKQTTPSPSSSPPSYWVTFVNTAGEGSGGGPVRNASCHAGQSLVFVGNLLVLGGYACNIFNQGDPNTAEIIDTSTTNSNRLCFTPQLINGSGSHTATQQGFAPQNGDNGISAGAVSYNDDDDQVINASVLTLSSSGVIEIGGWPQGSLWRNCDPTTFAGTPLSTLYSNTTTSFSWLSGGFLAPIQYFHDVGTPTKGDTFGHICHGNATACPNGNYIAVQNMRPGHTGSTVGVLGASNAAYTGTDCLSWGGRDDFAKWTEARDQGLLLRLGPNDGSIYKVVLTPGLTNMACQLLVTMTGDPVPSGNVNPYIPGFQYAVSPGGVRYAVIAMPSEAANTVRVGIVKLP